MSTSTGTHSYSSTLSWDTAGGTNYTALAEVVNIDMPALKVPAADFSNLNSPSATREKRPKMVDPGSGKFTLTWTKAMHTSLMAQLRTYPISWKVTYPLVGTETTASKATWTGFIGGIGNPIPEDDRITLDVDLEASGPITVTAGG